MILSYEDYHYAIVERNMVREAGGQFGSGFLLPDVKWRVEASPMFGGGFVRFRLAGRAV